MTVGNFTNNVRDLPFIGEWVGKVGKLNSIVTMPCGPSLDIWVTAAWVNLPKLAWSIFAPDCLDNVVARGINPHGKRGGASALPHKYRRRGKLNRWRIQDPSAWAGSQTNKIPIPPGTLSQALFRVFGVVQGNLYRLLLLDATADFLINWTSMAYESAGCTIFNATTAKGELTAGDLWPPTGNWGSPIWNETFHQDHVQFTNHIRITTGVPYLIGIAWQAKPRPDLFPNDQPVVETRLIDATSGHVWEENSAIEPVEGETGSVAALTLVPPNLAGVTDLIPQIRVTGGWVEIGGSIATVMPMPSILDNLAESPCVGPPVEWPTQLIPQVNVHRP